MPNIASVHPYVSHIVIGFLLIGVVFRLVSLSGRWTWTNPAAATLLLLGTAAAAVSVQSGTDAHPPVERVPGSRQAVQTHEDWGKRTRNIFLGVAALELLGLAIAVDKRKWLRYGSAVVGLAGAYAVVETGEHGGELVYEYAGGVGLRTGNPEDVGRLLLAGMYHQAMQDRKAGKGSDAGVLINEMARRWPADTAIRLLRIESMFRDSGNPAGALAALDSLKPSEDNVRLKRNVASMRAEAFIAAGMKDSARTIIEELLKGQPDNPRLKAKLDSLKLGASPTPVWRCDAAPAQSCRSHATSFGQRFRFCRLRRRDGTSQTLARGLPFIWTSG